MVAGIEKLKMLDLADWPKVRDISIPISRAGSNDYLAEIHGALCFTSSPYAYRFCDPANPDSILRATEIVKQANAQLKLGQGRFNLRAAGMTFRAQLGDNACGQDLQLRVLPGVTPTIHELQMPHTWRELLLGESLINGGLILLTAPNGQGKTTTASALVRSRLERFGGMANSIEDPAELPLHGIYGTGGVCFQRPVNTAQNIERPGEGYYRAMIEALRQFPAISGGNTILFVGEIRDALTAAETLKAAASGHLVIATMHAKSVETAIRRMMTLAADPADGFDLKSVCELLSESLRVVINQRLYWDLEQEGWGAAKVNGDVLWSGSYSSPVAEAIRRNNLELIQPIIRAQGGVLADLAEAPEPTEDIASRLNLASQEAMAQVS